MSTNPPPVPDAADIAAAAALLEGVAVRTPLQRSPRLSDLHGADILLKREDLQPVRSYKLRGAYSMIARLDPERRERGVVCASAGNHGQGVALSCGRLDIPAVVYVPTSTPRQKLQRIVALGGAQLRLHQAGSTFDESAALAREHATETGLPFVPAFDHPDVIAGQATVTAEALEQAEGRCDLVVAPVGGGGLVAGAVLVTEGTSTSVVGAEPAGAASMAAALDAGAPVDLSDLDTFVDGAAVRRVGDLPFRICSAAALRMVGVDEGDLCTRMLELYAEEGIITEPAGALAVAALEALADELRGRRVVCIVSGGNNDVGRYAEIAERSLVARGLKHYFLVEFPQRPGALRSFLDSVLGPNDDITFFQYDKRSQRDAGPALVGIELVDVADLAPLRARMRATGLSVTPIDTTSPLFRFLV